MDAEQTKAAVAKRVATFWAVMFTMPTVVWTMMWLAIAAALDYPSVTFFAWAAGAIAWIGGLLIYLDAKWELER